MILEEGQEHMSTCGPRALTYGVYFLKGKEFSERAIMGSRWTFWKSRVSGYDEDDLIPAGRAHGVKPVEKAYDDEDDAAKGLKRHLRQGLPALLCLYGGAHWVCACGLRKDGSVAVADPESEDVYDDWDIDDLIEESECREGYYIMYLYNADGSGPAKNLRFRSTPDELRGYRNLLSALIRRAAVDHG